MLLEHIYRKQPQSWEPVMGGKSHREVLIADKAVQVRVVLERLASEWGVNGVREIICTAYEKYHGVEALKTAKNRGFVDNFVRYFEEDGELPGCVVGMYRKVSGILEA